MHEFTDVTWAKQFHFDHSSANQAASFDDIEHSSSTLNQDQDDGGSSSGQFHHNKNQATYVRFSPESLTFGYHSIGMPIIKTVHIHNDDDEITLQLISISGNTEHFHCSFFEEKILPPRSNTSFQVVFLARQEGLVNNTLYIHSSAGSFPYRVSAYGEHSPFRIRPLIGARVPLNSSFASLIYIYNPFSTPLQLTEMYTSGGGLHLELPDDEYEAPSSLWNVPPYETRPVMKAHLVARIVSNHTSYIRIRTSQPDIQLMLPVEVEVSNSPGLYSPLDTLDFGVLRAKHDPPKALPIQVINAAQKSVSVQSIVVTPIFDGLSIADFSGPIKVPPQSSNPYHVAKLILDPSQFSCIGLCLGKVLIKSKNNQYKLTIPFIVRVIQGELHFNGTQSHFFMNSSSNYLEQRVMNVENRFDNPIIVHDIILPDEAKPYFRLTTKAPYSLPITLPVGKSFPLLQIEFTPSPQLSHFSTVFRLLTNLSYFDLPLYAYQGRLELFIPNSSDQSKLDMGLVGLNEQKTSTFVVANHNPIAIRLIYWQCNITGLIIELVGTSQGNISAISQRIESSSIPMESSPSPPASTSTRSSEFRSLEPNHFAVFRVHVQKLSNEGVHNGMITIITAYEKLTVPLTIKVLNGNLMAEPVILPKTFPGKIVKSMLNIKSNYSSTIKIKGAFIVPKDERFKIKLIDQLIKPGHDNQIQIQFDPSAACYQKLCYTALDVEKEVGHLWLLGSGLYSDTAYIDKELYKLLRNQWLSMTELDRKPTVNVRLQIDGFGSFVAPIQAHQHWPRLANKLVIRFPSIRVGQKVTKELLIENTADREVLVQAINVIDYPNSEILLQLTSNSIFHQQWSKSDLQAIQSAIRNGHNRSAFSLHNNTIASNSQVQRITEWLGVEPNANSYIMLLPAGVRHRLAVTFNPPDEKNYTSLLILRNNLTIIDVVMLRGEGGRGLLKIGKTLPNTLNSRLVFDFPERSLEKRCRNLILAKSGIDSPPSLSSSSLSSSNNHKPVSYNTLVMRERFKAVNIGRMALQIRNFLIDGMPCEGHGFRISRCEPILLSPNQTVDIEILYSPDFTQHTITHELTIMIDDDDSLGAQRFLLVANVPSNLLQLCLEALPRPIWEPHLYYILVTMALFVLILSTIVAIFDGHRIALNYYSSKYEFLNNDLSTTKKHDGNDDGNNGGNAYKCDNDLSNHNNSSSVIESAGHKILANGSSNMAIANGKHNHPYSTVGSSSNHNQLSNQKVRNRRGAKQQQPIPNGNLHQHRRSQSKSTTSEPSTTKQQQTETTSKHHHSNGSLDFDYESITTVTTTPSTNHHQNSSSWSHLAQSDFLRQDSSSSEHSNRSSDSSSFFASSISKQTSSLSTRLNQTDNKKSHSNDSLDEMVATPTTNTASNNNSGNNSPNASRQGKKSKRESSTSKSTYKLPTSKTMDKTQTEQFAKKPTPTVSMKIKNVAKNLDNGKKEKSSFKCNSISESLKSSQESLTSTKFEQIEATINQDFMPTKTRSATLPFTQNDSNQQQSKPTSALMANSDSSVYVSESNLSWNQTSAVFQSNSNENENHFDSFRTVSPFKTNAEQNYSFSYKSSHNKETKFDAFRTAKEFNHATGNSKSGYFGYYGVNDKNNNGKDIWDSPITSFDTELAMNQLVKQTEEFAAIDEKVAVSNNNRSSFNGQRRGGGHSKFQTTSPITDDKWEIGEWSNDLLERCSPSSTSSKGGTSSLGVNNGSNYESSMAQMKKYPHHHSRFPQSINYQEYRNSLNDKNHSSKIYGKQLFNMNDSNMTHINSKSLPQTTAVASVGNGSYATPRTISPSQSTSISPTAPAGHNINLANVQSSLSLNPMKTTSAAVAPLQSSSSPITSPGISTTTFSPVIGRPTTAQQQQQSSILSTQRNKLLSSPPTDSNHFAMFNSCLEKSLNQKTPLSLLSPFNSSSNSAKNLLGQLDSLLEPTSKSQSLVYEQQQSAVSNGLCVGGKIVNTPSTVNVNSLLQTTRSSPWNSEFNPTLDSLLTSNNSTSKAVGSGITGMFTNLADNHGHQDSVWPSSAAESTWPSSIASPSNTNIFSNFSESVKPSVNTFSSGLSPIESSSANRINWLSANSSSTSATNNCHSHTMIGSNNSTQTSSQSGGVWSAFDTPFRNYIRNPTFNANDNVDFNSLVQPPTTNHHHPTTMHQDPVGVSTTPVVSSAATVSPPAAFVDNNPPSSTVFELFGGKSPWAPLSSSPPNSTTANTNVSGVDATTNFLSPSPTSAATSELLFGRLSQNSSPVSSSNGSTTSASSISSNMDTANSTK
ncbi:hypothetical protein DERP_014428 [Dermatophagoides pteronyssinus]|uniref:Transmembrane protein 131-like n=1 Tax=Dermatophagoides pteronyssinus TaxID=6956 RepID=A0ABQ8IVY4_DERPT|nr:hypothetical protein DERP_014428 [Dermatophagoides pteronyssinus]